MTQGVASGGNSHGPVCDLRPRRPPRAGAEGQRLLRQCPGVSLGLAREYEKRTGVKVVVLGGGSVRGLTDLAEGRTDFAASCQSKSARDPRTSNTTSRAGRPGLHRPHLQPGARITSSRSVPSKREDRHWKQLGGPIASSFPSSRPRGVRRDREALEKYVLRGERPALQRNSTMQAPPWPSGSSSSSRCPGLRQHRFGSARKRNVKMLEVGGVAPTKEARARGRRSPSTCPRRQGRHGLGQGEDEVATGQGRCWSWTTSPIVRRSPGRC